MIKNKIFKNKSDKPIVLIDTCGLIDGRLVSIVENGFLPAKLIVPEFIVDELQLLADGQDSTKRTRARFGMDVIKRLQESHKADIEVYATPRNRDKTDDRLVDLAGRLGASLYTTDYNLNKAALIKGIQILNVNELANSLRPEVLPGEVKTIKIIQKGSSRGQGVGYLDDGTMIVVDQAANKVGDKVRVEIRKTHQSEAGKMMFGKLVGHQNQKKTKSRR